MSFKAFTEFMVGFPFENHETLAYCILRKMRKLRIGRAIIPQGNFMRNICAR